MPNPKGLKIKVFSQGTYDSKHLRCETLYIADYGYVKISSFAELDKKLGLEEDRDIKQVTLYIHSNSFNRRFKIDTKLKFFARS